MKKLLVAIVIVGAIGSMAVAGVTEQSTVWITSYKAHGTLSTTANTADAMQLIGCSTQSNLTSEWALCRARNAAGLTKLCLSQEPAILRAARSISSGSTLTFYWNSAGECSSIYVSNRSADL